MKTAEEILLENIPEGIKNEGFSYGDVHPIWIQRAMKLYAEQFVLYLMDQSENDPLYHDSINILHKIK